MEFHLQPQKADTTVFEGEGGGYYAWTPPKTPVVEEAVIGAGRLVLQPQGFALPHYADASKIGYVIQGRCTVGLILADKDKPEEKVVIINEGDAIPVKIGSISWWYNGGDSDVSIIFLGESSQSHSRGQFDYFFLSGAIGILRGLSTEFVSKMYGLSGEQSKELVESQSNALVVKIGATIHLPQESNCKQEEYIISSLGVGVEMTSPLVDEVGLTPKLVRLEADTMLDPYYSMAHQIMYVTKGGGRIQMVGLNGARVLDEVVEEGHLIFVPKFFLAAFMATHKGFEFFCVSTSPRALSMHVGGKSSAYKALSSSVLEAALNVSPEFVKSFKSGI
ncbi:cocosin 1-like [Salvia miltiorrhiza]|uniref:cocosin 1-like n=1 Tax=Salvia miltiorrhiza TaxID=226208 RepID=UPI0025AC0E0B|nr:cocosin 1-like [Salvia miltiorrhiza]